MQKWRCKGHATRRTDGAQGWLTGLQKVVIIVERGRRDRRWEDETEKLKSSQAKLCGDWHSAVTHGEG